MPGQWKTAGVVAALVCAAAWTARAQSQADYNRLLQMDSTYLQYKGAGRWREAEDVAEQMVVHARRTGMPKNIELAAVDYIALSELNLGNYEEALAVYRQVVAGCSAYRPPTRQIADALKGVWFNGLNGVARCYRSMRQNDEAIAAFGAAAKYAEGAGLRAEAAAARADQAHVLIDIGRVHEAIAQFEEAKPVLARAAAEENPPAAMHSYYANALQGLATSQMVLGRYNDAEPNAKRAIEICQRAYGAHPFTAVAMKVLALVYSYQNRFADARAYYEGAVEIYEGTVGKENPTCLGIMNNLARMYLFTGDEQRAFETVRFVVEQERARFGKGSVQTVESLINLGNILFQIDRYDEAAAYIAEAQAICEKELPPDHPTTVECLWLQLGNDQLRGGDRRAILAGI